VLSFLPAQSSFFMNILNKVGSQPIALLVEERRALFPSCDTFEAASPCFVKQGLTLDFVWGNVRIQHLID
jgi:hypothetical protein